MRRLSVRKLYFVQIGIALVASVLSGIILDHVDDHSSLFMIAVEIRILCVRDVDANPIARRTCLTDRSFFWAARECNAYRSPISAA